MRIVVFTVLALIPPALIGALVWEGHRAPPVERAPAANRPAGHEADQTLRALFEPAPAGTTIKEKVTLYDEKGLFDYIDGAAPIFIERHYRKLAAAELATPEGSDLVCDVYDMAAPANAQSIFDKEKSSQAKARRRLARGHHRPDVAGLPPCPLLREADRFRRHGRGAAAGRGPRSQGEDEMSDAEKPNGSVVPESRLRGSGKPAAPQPEGDMNRRAVLRVGMTAAMADGRGRPWRRAAHARAARASARPCPS